MVGYPLQSDLFAPSGQAEAKNADDWSAYSNIFSSIMRRKYEIWSYDGAAAILALNHPQNFEVLIRALERFTMTNDMLTSPGGGKSEIVKAMEQAFPAHWRESSIQAQIFYQKKDTSNKIWEQGQRDHFVSSHRFDLLTDCVAIEIGWNTKYYLFERDLTSFRKCRDIGAIRVGIIITRGFDLDSYCRTLKGPIPKIGTTGHKPANTKYTTDTTSVRHLLKRLDANHHEHCPLLVFGVTRNCIQKLSPVSGPNLNDKPEEYGLF